MTKTTETKTKTTEGRRSTTTPRVAVVVASGAKTTTTTTTTERIPRLDDSRRTRGGSRPMRYVGLADSLLMMFGLCFLLSLLNIL